MPSFLASHLYRRRKKNKNKNATIKKKKSKKKEAVEESTDHPHVQNQPRKVQSLTQPAASQHHTNTVRDDDDDDSEGTVEVINGFHLKSSSSSKSHIIQPLGNLLLSDPSSNCRDTGLGALRILTDELVLDVLGLLSAKELGLVALVSKSLYVFSHHDPLWRNLVLLELKGDFLFSGSWRSTYISVNYLLPATDRGSVISIRNFYSDYLFQSWLCASLEMRREWLETDNIQRRRGISVEEFVECFEEHNKPVLLENCVGEWPAVEKWDQERLLSMCGDAKFAVGPVEMRLEEYFRYASTAREERPLYLFDPKFAEKVPELGLDYEVPGYFKDDLFAVLGVERPDYRWIIIGPAGSGSSFHVDPNSTSAWNAVIKGSKKWVMFPPDVVPPGVHPSSNGADVVCPVSIIEWFMNFYSACRDWKKRPIECVCRAGDVVFVPNGWWHLVYNLQDSIAITQNYVSRRNLLNVLDFLKHPNASELVSGTADRVNLYDKFNKAVEASFPGTIDLLRQKAEEKIAQQKKPTFWESVTDARVGGFKFSS